MAPHTFSVRADERLGCVDLTEQIGDFVAASGIESGAVLVFCAHTTCSILVNEWESGALEDVKVRLDDLFPTDAYYAHDDLDRRTENLVPDERRNGHAHVAQMLMGQTSQMIPISGGKPFLGRWQRIFLIELDEPKDRNVVLHAFGQSSDQSLVMNSQNASPAYLP